MATMPGQRTIVLISPGFLTTRDTIDEVSGIIERAVRNNVLVGALDARGLYTNSVSDASQGPTLNVATMTAKNAYANEEASAQADVMANLSSGTGGTFYQNSNNFDEGLTRTAAAPEFIYVLGFSPPGLKTDGAYHKLKVVVKQPKGLSSTARKGYYAPQYALDTAGQAKQELQDAFFSRDEVHDLPAELQTQYFTSGDGDATLSAVAKIDLAKLAFHREADRNRNDITVVTGLFDNNGNYVTGQQKTIEMRLLDETFKRLGSGITVKSSFTVHPGRYVVRMVVRDKEGQTMAAQSSLVEIP
jgi:hypothetical protein